MHDPAARNPFRKLNRRTVANRDSKIEQQVGKSVFRSGRHRFRERGENQ